MGMAVSGLGGEAKVLGIGTLHGISKTERGDTLKWTLPGVYYIPNCGVNIVSAHIFVDDIDHVVELRSPEHVAPWLDLDNGDRILLEKEDQLATFTFRVDDAAPCSCATHESVLNSASYASCFNSQRAEKVGIDYAHVLLNHLGAHKMRCIKKHGLVTGLDWDHGELCTCYPCSLGKSKRNSTKKRSKSQYHERGDLVVSDIMKVSTPAFGAAK